MHNPQGSITEGIVQNVNADLLEKHSSTGERSKEGWLAPAQDSLDSMLSHVVLERGKATLPYCAYVDSSGFNAS